MSIRILARPVVKLAPFAAVLASVCGLSGQSADRPGYLNPDLPAEQRAHDLVSRMTIEEKVLQMQNGAPAIPRLNIPAYDWWNEALHGVARAGNATVFPQAIGLAATWDTDLMHRIADAISTEARAKYNQAIRDDNHARYYGLTFWSPNINIFRDPRWGRGQETYGEDPYLTGRLAVAFIKGMQGDDPHYYKVIATAKHYAVHSGPEPSRHEFDVKPSERDLNDTYLPAFRAAITEGKADSVMCAYNAVDGVPACANSDLLVKRLRDEWKFNGYIVSDCGAISDIFRGHKYKPDAASASAIAVKAGTDLTCGTEYRALPEAVKQGLITEAEIDRSLERLFKARFQLGMFDPPERVPFSKIAYSEVDSEAHRKLALEAARKSIVLLKNQNNALPIKATVRNIAVIGPSADDPIALLGNYNGFSKKHVTPLEGIEMQFGAKAQFHYALGATYSTISQALISATAFSHGMLAGRLRAEYFDNPEMQGEPKLSRFEPCPFIQAGVPSPEVAAAFGKAKFAVRWTGMLHPPVTGDYTITPNSGFDRGAAKIFLDDKELAPDVPANPAPGPGRGGPPPALHIHLDAAHEYRVRIEYRPQAPQPGLQITWMPPAAALLDEAVAAVKKSDVAVAFVGLNPNLEGEEMRVSIPGFAGGDRTDLNLPEGQAKLIEAAVATGKPVIVVLTSGSALAANYAAEHAAGVLELWYGGEEAGTAIAETLAGVNNPSGRLPVTFYRSADQLPKFDDYSMNGRTYRYFTGDALYGFGYGLSYSKFEYSAARATRTQVTVRVKNASTREGDEVVQVYANNVNGAIRKLVAFERVHLRAGESREVRLAVADMPQGKPTLTVGGSQHGTDVLVQ
jgi:beta-glucosidase